MFELDFHFSNSAVNLAWDHLDAGTAIEVAWPEVVDVMEPRLGSEAAGAAKRIALLSSAASVVAIFRGLLERDRPGAEINGLWFGLSNLELENGITVWVPYLSGSDQFDRDDPEWPVSGAWRAEECYAPNEAMAQLSDLCRECPDDRDVIGSGLVEPLAMLFVGRVVREIPVECLLGGAASRGIGCGFNDGNFRNLGVVERIGFRPFGKW